MLAWLLGILAIIGLGMHFVRIGLDRADKVSSALGIFVSAIGLAVAVYGMVLARRSKQPIGRQAVSSSRVGGDVVQVRNVRGSTKITLGRAQTALKSNGIDPPSGDVAGTQVIRDSSIGGSVAQVDDAGDDLDVGR